LFPQAIVPIAMKLSGNIAKVWFLALYLPASWQWPTIALMVLVAVPAFAVATRIFRTEQSRVRDRGSV
jgi:ABC-2 type transport system permease protein